MKCIQLEKYSKLCDFNVLFPCEDLSLIWFKHIWVLIQDHWKVKVLWHYAVSPGDVGDLAGPGLVVWLEISLLGIVHLYGHNWSTYAGHVTQVQVDCGYNRPEGWLVSVDGLDLSWWRGSADLVCAGLRSTLLAHCPLLTPAAQLTLSSGCSVKSLFWRIEGSQIDFEGLLYFCELRARAFWSQNKGMVWLGSFRQI